MRGVWAHQCWCAVRRWRHSGWRRSRRRQGVRRAALRRSSGQTRSAGRSRSFWRPAAARWVRGSPSRARTAPCTRSGCSPAPPWTRPPPGPGWAVRCLAAGTLQHSVRLLFQPAHTRFTWNVVVIVDDVVERVVVDVVGEKLFCGNAGHHCLRHVYLGRCSVGYCW